MNEVTTQKSFSLAPQDLAQAIQFAEILSKSNIVPKEFIGNPGNILVAIQWGMELGLQPMQAMQNIAIINGRPSLWGDAVIGLVRSSPVCEYIIEETIDEKAVCRVKRRGEDEQIRIFTIDDAKKAGLHGKTGPWTQYPKRMMQMRARSWALRDVFPDVLRGMPIAEEVMDIERDITPAKPVRQNAALIAKQTQVIEHAENYDALIADLEAVADTGSEALAQSWGSITKAQRIALAGNLEPLKARASAADAKGDEYVPA